MSDPFDPVDSLKVAEVEIKNYNFYYDLYPEEVRYRIEQSIAAGNYFDPPKCIFIPTQELVRTIMKAILKFGHIEDERVLLGRFGLSLEI
jgi:hypothetical protein